MWRRPRSRAQRITSQYRAWFGRIVERSARRCRCRSARSCPRTRGTRRPPRRPPSWSTMNIFDVPPRAGRARGAAGVTCAAASGASASCARTARWRLRRSRSEAASRKPSSDRVGLLQAAEQVVRGLAPAGRAERRGRPAASTIQRGRISSSSNPRRVEAPHAGVDAQPRHPRSGRRGSRAASSSAASSARRVAQRPAVARTRDRAQPGIRHQALLAHQRQDAGQGAGLARARGSGARSRRPPQDRRPRAEVVDGRRRMGPHVCVPARVGERIHLSSTKCAARYPQVAASI